jgi:MFS family permease
MGALFIDRVGGALLFPFFALYVTQKFGVGMTQVGGALAIFAVMNLLGGMLGGALTDKLGRRWMIIFGLVGSALSSLAMGLADSLFAFYLWAGVVGLLADAGGPAQQAMIADLLPPEKQAEGYGILRVVHNVAVAIGPMLGGLLAAYAFLWLFVADAATSLVTAVVVYLTLPETKPATSADKPEQSLLQVLGGYYTVLRDGVFITFIAISIVALLVYIQMYSTLSVYLRDVHHIPAQGFGIIMSINATIVVLFQFWLTRRLSKYAPLLMMALGTAFYAVGFAMYGFVATFALFIVAMVIITIGEMIAVPVAQALVAQFAPEEMRGRYMAIFGVGWLIPTATGPLLAGLIMDNYDPNWVWYASGLIGTIAVGGYVLLHLRVGGRLSRPTTAPPLHTSALVNE